MGKIILMTMPVIAVILYGLYWLVKNHDKPGSSGPGLGW